ncbi:MAG: VWA domain-containing protein, partial [Planctomycetia bacterium]
MPAEQFSLTVLQPWWLTLFLIAPLLVWFSRRSLSALGPARRSAALLLRLVVLSLLILALSELQLSRTSDKLCTLFVLDQSQSIPESLSSKSLEDVSNAIQRRKNERDEAGLIVFGRNARIEQPPAAYERTREIRSVGSLLDRQYTDVASAIQLALGSFPPDAARRIVLFCDGNQNRGNALAQAVLAKQNNVPIDVVPLEYRYDAEVLVDKVVVPPDLKKGDTANLKIVLRAARAAAGLMRLNRTSDDRREMVLEQQVSLREGLNVLTVKQTIDEPNFYNYEAQFEPRADSGDKLAFNNQASSFTWIRGEGRILFIESRRGLHQTLVDQLRAGNLNVTVRTSDQARDDLASLQQFDAVVVADVPAEELGESVQEALATNTREFGSGLIMIGGPDSFGAGGYAKSPLEKALPVDMEVPSTKVRGKGALVLVMHACEIPEGNYWQKQTAKLAVKMLGKMDECGLLYWDGQASWRFPLQAVGDGVRINSRIDTMTPGDMPNFTDTLQMSLNSLLKSTAMIKHVIVISDGDPQPPPASLLQAYLQAKITISTVSVASHGAFEKTNMQNIAKTTKGRYYEVTNSNRLPQIYIQETRVVARPLIYEQPTGWAPVVASPTEPTAGLPRELPPIRGLVLTTPKSTAEVPIISPLPADGDRNVLLAHWQYGLGKAVAFTSDGGRKWTADWKDQEIFGKFWSQLVRWSMRGGESENLSVSTLEKDGVVTVVVNAIDKTQEFL